MISNDLNDSLRMSFYGGIEAGGTKFSCVVGSDPDHILREHTIPTTSPQETLRQVIEFFAKSSEEFSIVSIGIGSFGPLDLDSSSTSFGYITNTPKVGWRKTDLVGIIGRSLKIPIVFDTDATAAAIGEAAWGRAQGLNDFVYVTVGTGIGGGIIINGKPLHGLLHPEVGHMRVPHDWREDPFPGSCLYHGDCLEGLAAGPAIRERWGVPGESIPSNHQAWNLESQYIAAGLVNLISTISPQRIILGGGIMKRPELLDAIRVKIPQLLNRYLDCVQLNEKITEYIVTPQLGDRSGILGALALAKQVSD